MTRFPAALDGPLLASLRAWPGVPSSVGARPREMFARAEIHGISGVIWDAWKTFGAPIDRETATGLEAMTVARDLDHEAHLALLHRIDDVLDVPAVALKGPLFATRYYERPSARGTSDVDLLIAEDDIERAVASLSQLRYRIVDSNDEIARSRREHHHLHLAAPGLPELELHFHACRGFGVTLRTETLAARSLAMKGFRTLRVPCAEDELVYLAVHAALHRFGRLAWLHDLRLLVDRMPADSVATAAKRARVWGVSRALALAGELLVDVLGVRRERVEFMGTLPAHRRALVRAVVGEPRTRVLSAATRFAYTTLLSDSLSASLDYARSSSMRHARHTLGID